GETIQKLVKLGLKRSTSFIPPSMSESDREEPYLFGLDDVKSLLHLLKSSEERVAFLRRIAKAVYGYPPLLSIGCLPIIQYIDRPWERHKIRSLAYALPTFQTSKKRKDGKVKNPTFSHTRWLGNYHEFKHPKENLYPFYSFPQWETIPPPPGFP